MKKSITALLMALCLALTLLPVQTLASSPNTAYANDPDAAQTIALQSIGPDEAAVANDLYEKLSNRASFIKLIDDIDVGTLTIDYEVTIDLNGHVLRMIGSGSVFKVENGGHLTITDSDPTAEHKFTPNADGLWVLDEQNGTKTVSGGVIYGGTGYKDGNHAYGGGVYIEANGNLTMTGGNIIGCTATGNNAFGGGVFVSKNGTFEMSGGSITGCTAVAQNYGMAFGGGIRSEGRTTLSGTAVIRDCHAKGGDRQYGGGISDAGTLNISGNVQIIGCTADGNSDAMYISNGLITGGTFYGSINSTKNIKSHIVTYQVNGADYATQIVPSNSMVTLLTPTKQGYAFDGWYNADGMRLDVADPVTITENLALTGWLYAPVTSESELTAALADSSIDVIRLTNDITLTSELTIPEGRNVTLDLNGHVLDLGGKYILVKGYDSDKYARLTIMDSEPTKEHKFTDTDGLWVLNETDGTETVLGGVITGGSNTSGGAMVVDWWGIVTMNGGNIVGCSASESGGAVSITGNFSFTMNGGSIVGCTASNGSAIYLKGGRMNANGGTVNGTVLVDVEKNNSSTNAGYIGGSGTNATQFNGDVTNYGEINCGTFEGTVENTGTISGGTFSGLIINNNADAVFSGAYSPLGIVGKEPIGGGHTYYKVTFSLNGGDMDYPVRYFLDGGNISDQIKPDSRPGYTFAGWYNGENEWDHDNNTVTGDMTLTAKWTRSHTNHCVCGGTSDVKHTHDVNTVWTAWTSTDSLPRDTGHYYLTDNVVLPADSDYVLDYYDESSETYYCPDLCLNGYTISFAAGGSDRKIVLENITTTQITDCQSAAGKIEPALQLADSGFGWVRVFNVTLAGGVENNGWAVCMYLYSGTLMNGITGTHADIYDSTVTGGILLSGSIGLYGSPNIDRLTLVDDEEAASPGYISRSSKLDAGVRIPITTQPLPTGQTPYELGEKMKNDLSGNLVPDAGYAVHFDADSKILTLTKAATITMGDNSWSDFDSTAKTLYCNTDQTLTIIDNSGGKLDISCLLTQEDLTQAQMGGLLFGEYTAPIVLREEGSHILYVMLFEPPFNFSSITYLRSARIVIDKTAPVLSLTDGKTYCGAQTVTITELHLKSVTVNGKAVTVDADQRFTLPAAGKQTIVVTDLAGNSTTVTVTVNAGHTWGAWMSNGDDTHSRKCTVPGCTADSETEKCTGGKADCCHKAVCDICKAAYGKVDPNNHHSLKHVKADRATTTSYGNIEYWYCEGCHRYFKDAACTIQITEDATRISPKSSSGTDNSKNGKNDKDKGVKSSDTGDSGLHLWVTLLLTSAVLGGAVLITGKRHRTR